MCDRQARRTHLTDVGFRVGAIEHWEKYKPSLFPEKYVNKKIAGFLKRGFKNPVRMIGSHPALMGLNFSNIDSKLRGLKDRGFNNPQKMVTMFPGILGFSFANIDSKITGLKERGFSDPIHIITLFPSILSYGFDNIDKKIDGLRMRGFKDPIAMIYSAPVILGYRLEVVDVKIEWLRENGFENPVQLIAGFPVIISLGCANLATKIRYARRMETFGVRGTELIEKYPTILSYNIKRIFFVARLAGSFEGIDARIFVRLLRKKPESLIVAACHAERQTRKAFLKALALYEALSQKETSVPQGEKKLVLAYLRYKG